MSEPDPIMDLLRYYTTGQVDPILLRKANAILGRCSAEIRNKAIDWITDNIPRQDGKYRHELSVTDMRQALKEIGEQASEYIPAEQWTCDACGLQFQYAQVVDYADKHDKGIFDYCPRCGFQPCDTIQARAEAEHQGGRFRDWYRLGVLKPDGERHVSRIDRFLLDYAKRGHWLFDKKEDDEFMVAKKRAEIDAMKREASEEIRRLSELKKSAMEAK